ncbi:hypothetical protein [Candidatus Nitrososphaera evergladensis]|uniref:hypothetical protein n=1 Tax=Candidatus Nitrososphaera evergladensis TaxID=1459637 RepID=UPI00130D8699|nr:hypothetical protein [Candidatus Nitrososphaera evergladensis]
MRYPWHPVLNSFYLLRFEEEEKEEGKQEKKKAEENERGDSEYQCAKYTCDCQC